MTLWKASLPAILVSTSAFLAGCFDMAQEPKSQESNTLTTSAFTGGSVFICAGCGHIPAFTPVSNPAKPYGWALDLNAPVPGGYAVRRVSYNYNTNQIDVVTRTGGLVDIDIYNNFELWGVNNTGGVFRNTGPNIDNYPWDNVPSNFQAVRIGAGASKVYVLGYPQVAGGYSLYKWTGSMTGGAAWQLLSPAGLTDIDVDNNGDLWGVNNNGHTFYLKAGDPITSIVYKGAVNAATIACGNTKVYARNTSGKILQYAGGSWSEVSVAGYNDIHVDHGGRLWASAVNGNINTWSGL